MNSISQTYNQIFDDMQELRDYIDKDEKIIKSNCKILKIYFNFNDNTSIKMKSLDADTDFQQDIKLGRHESNFFNFELNQTISKFHAQLFYENEQYFFMDLGSSNGTFQKIRQCQIEKNSIIRLGCVNLQLVFDDIQYTTYEAILYIKLYDIMEMEYIKSDILKLQYFPCDTKLTIGRGDKTTNTDFQINNKQVSRYHCDISFDENSKLIITDHGSVNGLYIKLKENKKVLIQYKETDDFYLGLAYGNQQNEGNLQQQIIFQITDKQFGSEISTGSTIRQTLSKIKQTVLDDNDVQEFISQYKCEPYRARMILSHFGGNYQNSVDYLQSTIQFCNGDTEQAIKLVVGDICEIRTVNDLIESQKKAISLIATHAKKTSERDISKLQIRIKELGFTEKDTEITLKYIRDEAPIIIHFNLAKCIQFFINDTHYRNQFETSTSGGLNNKLTRHKWESVLFETLYDEADPFQRVKYGVLNILNDPKGVDACRQYGKSYFILKEVRLRTTFCSQDTGDMVQKNILNVQDNLATCQYYAHILNSYNNNELRDVIEVAKRLHPKGKDSANIKIYKEIQIHGELRIDRHVKSLFYSQNELEQSQEIAENLELFKKKYPKIQVEKIPAK